MDCFLFNEKCPNPFTNVLTYFLILPNFTSVGVEVQSIKMHSNGLSMRFAVIAELLFETTRRGFCGLESCSAELPAASSIS